jgi:glutamine cyclotransferase
MKLHIFLTLLIATVLSCGSNQSNNKVEKLNFQIGINKNHFVLNETLKINFNEFTPDSSFLFLNNQLVAKYPKLNNISLGIQKTGLHKLSVMAFSKGVRGVVHKTIRVYSDIKPKQLSYRVVNQYKHSINDYTQGLEFNNGYIIEGTGRKGKSVLKSYDLKTGKIRQIMRLEDKYFGEGITVLNNKIYQITWTSGIGFVYNKSNLKREASFRYQTEGWGLTNNGKDILMSSGTNRIYKFNPKIMRQELYLQVADENSFIRHINELEYVDGKIYANVYLTNTIVVIDEKSGAVEAKLDLDNLFDIEKYRRTNSQQIDVLNGIAYNKKSATFYITGKLWPTIFEIKIQ